MLAYPTDFLEAHYVYGQLQNTTSQGSRKPNLQPLFEALQGIKDTLAGLQVENECVRELEMMGIAPGGRGETEVHSAGKGAISVQLTQVPPGEPAGLSQTLILTQRLFGKRCSHFSGPSRTPALLKDFGQQLVRFQTAAEQAREDPACVHAVIKKEQLHQAHARRHILTTIGAIGPALHRQPATPQLAKEKAVGFIAQLHHFLQINEELQGQSVPVGQTLQTFQASHVEKALGDFDLIPGDQLLDILENVPHLRGQTFCIQVLVQHLRRQTPPRCSQHQEQLFEKDFGKAPNSM
jgi:hypothetical protein